MRIHTLWACMSLLTFGCGEAKEPDVQAQLPGSYTLTFASVTETKVTQINTTARLDLQDDAGSLKAALTVEWSPPSPCTAVVGEGQLQLECTADVAPPTVSRFDRDRWTSIVIPLSAQGGLGQTFTATGVYVRCGDDYCSQKVPTNGGGSVAVDSRSPESTAAISSGDDPLLPWSRLSVGFSEPVDPQAVLPRLQLSNAGTTVPVAWEAEPVGRVGSGLAFLPENDEASAVWAGRMVFGGRLSTWDGLSGATLLLTTTPGILDPAGNEASPVSLSKKVLDLKAPASSFDFDAAIPAGTWGPATIAGATECESGGCLKLGPANPCSVWAGVAGLLPEGTRSKARIRYRAARSQAPMNNTGGLALLVASPGLPPDGIPIPEGSYHEADAGAAGQLSDWTTAEVALPPAVQAGRAGFSIAFTRNCLQWGEPQRTAWIESIVFE